MNSVYADPKLYDLLFKPEPFASYYTDIAKRASGAVCEFACGTGQLIIPISEFGRPCVGVDLDAGMLARAREVALASGSVVEFVHGDMRNVTLDREFGLVFVARNSLLHLHTLQDLSQFLEVVKEHLSKDGVFAFDVFNPDVSLLASASAERKTAMEVVDPGRGKVIAETTSRYREDLQVVESDWYFSTADEPDFAVATLSLRCIFPQELSLLLASCGFSIESLCGDFEGTPFGAGSGRQVCVCRVAQHWPL